MYNIAICITAFLRDTLLFKTIQSIIDNYTEGCVVLIADQGYNSEEKNVNIDYYKSQIPLEYYKLPFDCGLSYARNFLVNKAKEMNIPYCLISADSILFLSKYNFNPIIQFLELDEKRGLVGFELKNSKCPWEYNLNLDSNGIHLISSNNVTVENNINYKKCEIVRNIFLAKTQTLINLWDSEMKLGEHELAFIEYKKRGYEVYWTDSYIFKKCNQNTGEYNDYRARLGDYIKILKQKLNIKTWVIYEK